MYATFCDSCQQKIADDDLEAIHVQRRHQRFQLCGTCSAGVLVMLKDMRLIRELNVIR